MIETVEIEKIYPNPYQPREREDPEHVAKIAESIKANGLLQAPVGRRVNGHVELAFGHTRLAAMRLNAVKIMPVNILALSDEEMFAQGVTENLARKDLTPLEEARAMKRYRDEFGKTSAQIGELFGLSESAVRNKIRLLELPEGVRAQISAGSTISEGAARELLTLFDLPEALRRRAEDHWDEDFHPSEIVRSALNGAGGEHIREQINHIVAQYGRDMSRCTWKHDKVFEGVDIHHPDCKSCPDRVMRNKVPYCLVSKCYYAKQHMTEREYLDEASAACGIPVLEGDQTGRTEFDWHSRHAALAVARAAGCPNLRLKFASYERSDPDRLPDYPHAQIVCEKRSGHCTCLQATEAKPAVAVSAETLTAEDLKQVARQAKKDRKESIVDIQGMRDEVAGRFAYLLQYGGNEAAWRMVLRTIQSWKYSREEWQSAGVEELLLELGKLIAEQINSTDFSYVKPDAEQALERYNRALLDAGLRTLHDYLHNESEE